MEEKEDNFFSHDNKGKCTIAVTARVILGLDLYT